MLYSVIQAKLLQEPVLAQCGPEVTHSTVELELRTIFNVRKVAIQYIGG